MHTQDKDNASLEGLGGVQGLCEALQCSSSQGIDPDNSGGSARASLQQRQQAFGANAFREVPTKSFFVLLFENLKDPTLLLLMAAAMVSYYLKWAHTAGNKLASGCQLHGTAIGSSLLTALIAGHVQRPDRVAVTLTVQPVAASGMHWPCWTPCR